MRVVVRQEQQYDLCDVSIFRRAINDNEDLAVVVSQRDCPQCRSMRRTVRKLEGKIEPPVVDIDLFDKEDPCQAVADLLDVKQTPTVVYFRGGKEVGRFVGSGVESLDLEKLRALLPVSE